MIEWLALILLIPLILVPIVLLFGFAGCDVVLGLEPPAFRKTFEWTPLDEEQQRPNRCIVQRIEEFELAADGFEVQITVQRPMNGMLLLNSLYISRAADHTDPSRDPYDPAEDLTAVVSESEPLQLAPDPAKPLVELPQIDYDLDSTQPLLLAFDIGADGSGAGGSVPRSGLPNVPAERAEAYLGPTPPPPPGLPIHEAGKADRQSGYNPVNRIYLVQRIDAKGA
jgi:hypothetical protein